ncbi:MAG: ABC-F family ATP-binding cassette domain-containing protein [Candidatus Omnitrophica bacterium]|nr:ABC-F family ATP-binding cassette domain-containing protein [Candidatus Omnitrophota bacterium]
MLNVEGLCKSYGPFPVLHDISFSLNRNMPVGLVGANGVGKSTLLKIIAGQEVADGGAISVGPRVVIGYLSQTLPILSVKTVGELIYESTGELHQLETRMRDIEKIMSTAEGNLSESLIDEYGEISHRFEERGGYNLEHQAAAVMEGLGLGSIERTRLVKTLSGGEKTRLGLAMLLLRSPDILLLDEPTNNLDDKCLGWLESYLNSDQGGIIMVSHDRQFLNATAKWIYEIDEHTHSMGKYCGNYDDFKAAKDRERTKWEESYKQQQEEIKELKRVMRTTASEPGRRQKSRDGDKFIVHFKGERLQSAASRNIRSARERLSHIMEDPIPKPPKPLRFKAHLGSDEIRSAEVIRTEKLGKSYDGKIILQDISFTLGADSKVVITGANGSGKTTLLRLLSGKEKPDSGEVDWAPGVRLGYLPQEPDGLQRGLTLLEYYRSGLTGYDEDFIFGLVTCGLFNYDELNKTLGQVSIGQLRKLEIARLIAVEPNVLLLDEPTNHISLDVLESFEVAITSFKGPVLAVSHDRRFIQKFGQEVWELAGGKILLKG